MNRPNGLRNWNASTQLKMMNSVVLKPMEFDFNPTAILTTIGGVATTILAWTQGQKAAKGSHLANVDAAIKIWQNTAEAQTIKLAKLEEKQEQLIIEHQECASLRTIVEHLRGEVAHCEEKHAKVEQEIEQWKEFVRKGQGFPTRKKE
jgi:hypothetical protein